MEKVIHLLPYDGIGGAEAAARSMVSTTARGLDFRVRYVFPGVRSARQRWRTNNPLALLAAVRAVLREKPDLLIVSLWRSCIVGILVRLLRRQTRLVVLIHNSVDAHGPDRVFTRWAMKLCCAVWADSEASASFRFEPTTSKQITVLPFLTEHLNPVQEGDPVGRPAPHFIFWGRLAAQKNLTRAISLFHRIREHHPQARFTVIGPDAGALAGLQAYCSALSLGDSVRFAGPMAFSGIIDHSRDHAFYLQTSAYEGMAMSVVEAMQLGLVPVVTPVGEIGRYCRNGINAVVIDVDEAAVASVLKLIEDPTCYAEMRRKGIDTWSGKPLYRDAVLDACRRLLDP